MFVLRSTSSVSALSPEGMDKSGTQALPSQVATILSGWVQRSGFPSTVIDSNNALRVVGSGPITIQARVQLTSNYASGSAFPIALLRNGAVIKTANFGFNVNSLTLSATAITAADGDLLQLRATPPFAQNPTVQQGAAATYLYFTVP